MKRTIDGIRKPMFDFPCKKEVPVKFLKYFNRIVCQSRKEAISFSEGGYFQAGRYFRGGDGVLMSRFNGKMTNLHYFPRALFSGELLSFFTQTIPYRIGSSI